MTKRREYLVEGACELSSFRYKNALNLLPTGFTKAFLTVLCLQEESSHVPGTRYGLRFVISHHAFDVMTFEIQVAFEAYDMQ